MEFGGAILRIKGSASSETLQYFRLNGTPIRAFGVWFVEGWEHGYEDAALVADTEYLGDIAVECLGGLSESALAAEIDDKFDRLLPYTNQWLSERGQEPK